MESHFSLEVQAGFEPADNGVADAPNKFGLISKNPYAVYVFIILLYIIFYCPRQECGKCNNVLTIIIQQLDTNFKHFWDKILRF